MQWSLPGTYSSPLLLQTISAFSVDNLYVLGHIYNSERKYKEGRETKEIVQKFLCILFPFSYLFLLSSLLFFPSFDAFLAVPAQD